VGWVTVQGQTYDLLRVGYYVLYASWLSMYACSIIAGVKSSRMSL
jgi:hypothetical protein